MFRVDSIRTLIASCKCSCIKPLLWRDLTHPTFSFTQIPPPLLTIGLLNPTPTHTPVYVQSNKCLRKVHSTSEIKCIKPSSEDVPAPRSNRILTLESPRVIPEWLTALRWGRINSDYDSQAT
ncbi:hypothetical protein CDAR_217811 [Caerostris darwini]|uniref:Uncharacterized protein n=1 Tax=Caerostris darwini TaxID=1538125 RepID=A0AAV4MY23_9ARAC|nr:hypothetical protein CDAR_217811 [Caerostris darwini]